jgi:cysteine desulfurase/selenocysteine lyase
MEHHSNDLPWRAVAETLHVDVTPAGRLDEADLDAKLAAYGSRVALVAITGASNVTGYINPIHRLAEKAHRVGALFLADCAQLAPHRSVACLSLDNPGHLDFVAISAHKMYAPFGTGALVGRRDIFEEGDPDMRGGGTVEIVTIDDVIWAEPPDKEEAGSPNTVGAIALAAAIRRLESVGMAEVARHEAELTAYALQQLNSVPGIRIYGDTSPECAPDRLGVIPFQLEGISHFLVASILGYEFGIGVRSGCFCAHPYILRLLGLNDGEAGAVRERMISGDRSDMPGLIRASFGLYNTLEEIDVFAEALKRIAQRDYQAQYLQDRASGEYRPLGWQPEFSEYFTL